MLCTAHQAAAIYLGRVTKQLLIYLFFYFIYLLKLLQKAAWGVLRH